MTAKGRDLGHETLFKILRPP